MEKPETILDQDTRWVSGLREEVQLSMRNWQNKEHALKANTVSLCERLPSNAYLKLVELSRRLSEILPEGVTSYLDEGSIRDLSEGDEHCIVEVISGYVSLNVSIRDTNQWRNLAVLTSPLIIGLNQLMSWTDQKTTMLSGYHGGAQVRFVPLSQLEEALNRHQAWEIFARMQALSSSYLLYMHALLHPGSAYEVVRGILMHMAAGECQILRHSNATSFITERSGLSRSSIAGILTSLNRRGYIRMVHGRLEEIGYLPEVLK